MRKAHPSRPSLELDDYSGEFQPDLHLSDFSKEGLMKLVEVGGAIYGDVNRQWYKAAIKSRLTVEAIQKAALQILECLTSTSIRPNSSGQPPGERGP